MGPTHPTKQAPRLIAAPSDSGIKPGGATAPITAAGAFRCQISESVHQQAAEEFLRIPEKRKNTE
jgi:hypothetical protein